MGFLKPKIPTPAAAPKPANPAMDPMNPALLDDNSGTASAAASLISTASRGLTRKAKTQRTTLLGGSS